MFFISSEKLFPVLRYLNFYPDFFNDVGKRFVEKGMANLKIYEVTN